MLPGKIQAALVANFDHGVMYAAEIIVIPELGAVIERPVLTSSLTLQGNRAHIPGGY